MSRLRPGAVRTLWERMSLFRTAPEGRLGEDFRTAPEGRLDDGRFMAEDDLVGDECRTDGALLRLPGLPPRLWETDELWLLPRLWDTDELWL